MKLPLNSNTWGEEEISAAIAVLKSRDTTMGNKVLEFESNFAKYFGSNYAIMSNSGSSANLLAVAAIAYERFGGKTENLEVVVPSISWATTYYPLSQLGFKMKFVDIDNKTLNMDFDETLKAINRNTVGIFAVNLLGQPSELQKFRELCDQNQLFLLEDNCESMGAKLDSKFTGTYGDIGTFSFFYSHHINTMEGGICLTDNRKLYEYMHSLRAHGWTRGLPEKNYVHNKTGNAWADKFLFALPGYNLRPLEISAAIGIVQLKKFEKFIEWRQKNASHFYNLFYSSNDVQIQTGPGESSAFAFSFVLKNKLRGKRDKIINELTRVGIESRPIVAGNFLRQPVIRYLNSNYSRCVNADYVHENGFYIGNHHFDIRSELNEVKNIVENCAQS